MRRASLILLLAGLLGGVPARARAHDIGRDFGLAGASVGLNLLYTPPKLLTAFTGFLVGTATAVFTGCDVRSMYAVWVPTVTGTYFITPAHLEGEKPIEFLGSHYPAVLTCAPELERPDGRCATPQMAPRSMS